MCRPSENIWSVGIAAFVFSVFVCWWATSLPTLPIPPDFTPAEMSLRVYECCRFHASVCKTCPGDCPELTRVVRDAITVGDWKYFWTVKGQAKWQYIGRPIPGWRWNVFRQSWIKRGNNAE